MLQRKINVNPHLELTPRIYGKTPALAGFSLIELMVALAVFALVATLAVPNIRNFVQNNQMSASANNLMGSLALARSEAVKRNTQVSVCASSTQTGCTGSDWNNGWIVFVDGGNPGVVDGNDEILNAIQGLPGGMDLSSTDPYIQFKPNGSLASCQFCLLDFEKLRVISLFESMRMWTTRAIYMLLPGRDVSAMSEGESTHKFTILSDILLTLIKKAGFAMSVKEMRYYLNGVFLHENNDDADNPKLCSVSTDGHRLAFLAIALPAEASGMPSIILPRKTVYEICKILEEQEGDTEISLSNGKIKFSTGNIVLLSKLVDATFPDYNKAIPQNNNIKMEVNTQNLMRAIDRVSTISSEKTKGIKFVFENGKLILSAQDIETGTSKEELDILFDAEKIEMGLNSKYMMDLLNQIDGDTTQFLLSNSDSPVLINDPSDIRAQYVIMPMRV